MATLGSPNKTSLGLPPDSTDFLYSWKEMAVFLKCGVRTAQRWEKSEGLPVHRHRHGKRGTVYALKSEIQDWLMSRREARDTNSLHDSSDDSSPVTINFPAMLDNARLNTLCELARLRAERVRSSLLRPKR